MEQVAEKTPKKRGRGRPSVPLDLGIVLDVAREEFARRGFDAVTLQDVADQAGASKAALYYHHPTKAALYDAVLDEDAGFMLRLVVDARLEEGSFVDRLDRLGALVCDAFAARPAMPRLLLREFVGQGRYIQGIGEERTNEILGVVAAFFAAGMDEGVFRRSDPRQLAVSVAGLHLFAWGAADLVSPFLGEPLTSAAGHAARKAAVLDQVRLLCGVAPVASG
jgi:AcrR family transcriptional regulator